MLPSELEFFLNLNRELHPYEPLHASTIQQENEIERDISSLIERDQNETLNEIYNETKPIRLLLTGKGAVPKTDSATIVTENQCMSLPEKLGTS